MPDAKGAVGAARYPALARNPKLSVASYAVFMVTNGRAGMPPFARLLDDDQIASVVNYVRTHFGNDYKDAVMPADVKAARP
jgi:mono/diheme cytochrome c family protein